MVKNNNRKVITEKEKRKSKKEIDKFTYSFI